MSYVVLAFASAILFGIWKFGLSFYRGKVSVYAVILVSACGAGVVYLLLGTAAGTLIFTLEDVPEGLIGGTLNFLGTLCVLRAFARGPVGVVSGVGALYVLVPLGYSLVRGEQPTMLAAVGVALLIAGLLAFYAPHASGESVTSSPGARTAILLALIAAAFYGSAIVVLDVGSLQSVDATLALSQIPQIVLALAALVIASGESLNRVTGTAVAVIAGSGVAVALGNIAFFTAANEGDIGVVAVLGALNPMVTALLAAVFFRERLGRSDYVAFAIVIAGAACVVA